MKIPKTLKISGFIYEITNENLWRKSGSSDFGKEITGLTKIWINTEYNKSQQESTLIHEIIEAINSSNDLKLYHLQISVLETSLYQVLKDNNLLK